MNNTFTLKKFLFASAILYGSIGAAHAQSPTKFPCGQEVYITSLINGDVATQLYKANVSTNPITYTKIGNNTSSIKYNATGLNPVDRFLYAIRSDSAHKNELIRIGYNGVMLPLGKLTSNDGKLDTLSTGFMFNSGCFDNSGNYYAIRENRSKEIYKINVANRTAQVIPLVASGPDPIPSLGVNIPDIAYNPADGNFYGSMGRETEMGRRSIKIDISSVATTSNAIITFLPNIPDADEGSVFGFTFATSTGNVYGFDNVTGNLYQFNTATGKRTYVSSSPYKLGATDGAYCGGADPFAPAPPAFTCNKTVYQTSAGGGIEGMTQLYKLDVNASPMTYTKIGHNALGIYYNSTGYNPIDNLLYGIRTDPGHMNELVRIGSDGTIQILGAMTSNDGVIDTLANSPDGFNSGCFDNAGNFLALKANSSKFLYKINVNTLTAQAIPLVAATETIPPQGLNVPDIALNPVDGNLYGVVGRATIYGRRTIKIDLSTIATTGNATVTYLPVPPIEEGSVFGFVFATSNGKVYGVDNLSGTLFQLDLTTGRRILVKEGPLPGGNDGAYCGGGNPFIPEPTPFACGDKSAYHTTVLAGDTATQLYKVDLTSNPVVHTKIGTNPEGISYNAVGLNPVDNFLYGVRGVAGYRNELVRVGSNGSVEVVGKLTSTDGVLDTLSTADGFNGGVFDPLGNYYITRGNVAKHVYKVNINTRVAQPLPLVATGSDHIPAVGLNINDLAYNFADGKLYGAIGRLSVYGRRTVKIEITSTNALITYLPAAPESAGSVFGFIFATTDGQVFGFENLIGGLYRFDLTTGNRTLVANSAIPIRNASDGAYCGTPFLPGVPAFTCDKTVYQTSAGGGIEGMTQLYKLDVNASPMVYTKVGHNALGIYYNSTGYNPVDNLLYGIRTDVGHMNELVRIGSDGTVQILGAMTSNDGVLDTLSNSPDGFNSGCFDNAGNFLALKANSSKFLYKINVHTLTAQAIPLVAATETIPPQGLNVPDIALNPVDGNLYGVVGRATIYGRRTIKIDLSTIATTGNATVTYLPVPPIEEGSVFGFVFATSTGKVYGVDNLSGTLFRLDLTTGRRITVNAGPLPGGNDGAYCGGDDPVEIASSRAKPAEVISAIKETENAVKVFPTVSSGSVSVKGTAQGDVIILTDASGRTLQKIIAKGANEELNISRYSSGLYNIIVLKKDNTRANFKVLRN